MELRKDYVPSRTPLYAEEAFVLTEGEKIKIMTPGDPPVVRLELGPEVGKQWNIVVSLRGEEMDV